MARSEVPELSSPIPATDAISTIAASLRERGDLDAAMARFSRAHQIKERVLGPQHPDVATIQLQMAEVARAQQLPRKALALYTRAWPAVRSHLGDECHEIAEIAHKMGVLQTELGQLSEAATSFENARAVHAKVHGAGHSEVSKAIAHLGWVRQLQDRLTDAAQLFEEALQIRERCLGEFHADVGVLLAQLANVRQLQRRGHEAADMYKRALTIQQRAVGDSHLDVATTLGNLGRCLARLGRLAEAEDAYRSSSAIFEQHHGADHHETQQCRASLASLVALRGGHAVDFNAAFGFDAHNSTAAPRSMLAAAPQALQPLQSQNSKAADATTWMPTEASAIAAGVATVVPSQSQVPSSTPPAKTQTSLQHADKDVDQYAKGMAASSIQPNGAMNVENNCAPLRNGPSAGAPFKEEPTGHVGSDSIAGRLAANRRARSAVRGARRKQYAAGRQTTCRDSEPATSILAACKAYENDDAMARKMLLDRYWHTTMRG